MHSPGINGEGELRGQPANPGSPGKWPLKRSVCVCGQFPQDYSSCACVPHRFSRVQQKTFEECWSRMFYQVYAFLSLSSHCQSTEGLIWLIMFRIYTDWCLRSKVYVIEMSRCYHSAQFVMMCVTACSKRCGIQQVCTDAAADTVVSR